jgi:hypothetical protein
MEASRFDELTKALATATSRRQALRKIGAILGGTALAGLFPGLALAGNSACAKFCNGIFGDDTPAANQCISQAAHHQGLCYTCGPAAPAGHPSLCGQVCCSSGQGCCSGTCIDIQTDTNNCGACNNSCNGTTPGQCQNGSCVCFGLQHTCTSASQCCGTGQGLTTCAFDTGRFRCCNQPGGSCRGASDCCGTVICRNGTCECNPSGISCFYDFDCCSGTCNGAVPGTQLGTCA